LGGKSGLKAFEQQLQIELGLRIATQHDDALVGGGQIYIQHEDGGKLCLVFDRVGKDGPEWLKTFQSQ
jgi:hypothetical protein